MFKGVQDYDSKNEIMKISNQIDAKSNEQIMAIITLRKNWPMT